MTPFWKSVAATFATTAALAALDRAHPSRRPAWAPRWLQQIARDVAHHGPNEEDESGLLAGYYEDLLNASKTTTRDGDAEEGWQNSMRKDDTFALDRSFRRYRLRPNLDLVTAGGERVVTNRFGMADVDYPEAKGAGVRRIAWVGDSLTRGLGAPFGEGLEARVERWLEAEQTGGAIHHYELLNLGIDGYRLTQMVDVVAEALPQFRPDVVLLGISDLSVSRTFGNHLAGCVHDGIEIPYPFLRELVARAGIRPDDSVESADSKLQRYRRDLVAECLDAIAAGCKAGGAELIVVALPAVNESEQLEARFIETRALLASKAIPLIDLIGTFADVDDLDAIRVSKDDHHPKAVGYELLFQRMRRELAASPAIFERLLGHPPLPSGR